MHISPMEPRDVGGVLQVQSEVFANHLQEKADVFYDRLRFFPPGCWVARQEGRIIGYLVSHPWRMNHAPSLNTFPLHLPQQPDCYYIHDIATSHSYQGVGRALAQQALRVAAMHGFMDLALISVQESKPLCERLGFRASQAISHEQLSSYGEGATYMQYSITPS